MQLHGLVGIYKANSVGDDIEVYSDGAEPKTFFTLREQAEKETKDPFMALSDFVAPKDTGISFTLSYSLLPEGVSRSNICFFFPDFTESPDKSINSC